ncbi:MAG TPA: thiamine-phosphate kinase [Xanthobacteraceae bacterium]|nr:thiamine-phosphate kinase [Xanthobacteraceae bacterium]
MSTKPSGEDSLIERFFRPLVRDPGAFDLRDDTAAIRPPADCDLVLTTDAVIEGVHFFPGDPAQAIAKKALRANLSDLAAKGAEPRGFLLTLAMPKSIDEEWIAAFADGLAGDIEAYNCPLLGGDTDSTPGLLSVSITAFGTVPQGKIVRRAGAEAGDVIAVSGTLGDAALGLALRRDKELAKRAKLGAEEEAHLLERYLVPQPRTELANTLRAHAHAAMDISDGLAGDLVKLAAVSGVSASVEVEKLPLSPAAQKLLEHDPKLVETICTGGDDYEILAAVPREALPAFQGQAKESGISLTEIGVIGSGERVEVKGADGQPLRFKRASFSHF